MAWSGTAFALLLTAFASTPSLSPLERNYLASRDEHIRRLAAEAAHSTPDEKSRGPAPDKLDAFIEEDRRALSELEAMLRAIVGPVDLPGVHGPGAISLETLDHAVGFGNVDGLSFHWGGDRLLVTTRGLLDAWVAAQEWQQRPSDHLALSSAEALYTFAFSSEAACYLLGEVPVVRAQGITVARAFLAGYSQDQGPSVPTDLVVFVERGDRIFMVESRIGPPLEPVAACKAERKAYEESGRFLDGDYEVYRRCYGRAIRDGSVFAPLRRRAQAIVDRMQGAAAAPARP